MVKRMILDRIAESTRRRVAQKKEHVTLASLKERMKQPEQGESFLFKQALRAPGISFICEVKKASPSKGLIAEEFDYLTIAKEYEAAGAAAISVLTEPEFFLGSDRYLEEIVQHVTIPVLRKDFVVDEYQIYEAKVLGAAAVLLICEITEEKQLARYLEISRGVGLSALVEAHTPEQIQKAIRAGAGIIGVNNRDLTDFGVDTGTAERLRRLVPQEVVFVSESGIRTPEDIALMQKAGADAVLIGETLMKSSNKAGTLAWLKGESGWQG